MTEYDVIIVGAGPAGTTCASLLGMQGKKVLLVDKAKFPRDKICGDGIFNKSFPILESIGIDLKSASIPKKIIAGITVTILKEKSLSRKVNLDYTKKPILACVCKRELFDNMLFENAKRHADTIESFTVKDIFDGGVIGVDKEGKEQKFFSKIMVGADGAKSIVAKKLGSQQFNDEDYAVALRGYYSRVKGLTDKIEIHYLKELSPGYLWIFPTGGPNNEANVGLGMRCSELKNKDFNLKNYLFDLLEKNVYLKERFQDAKLEGKVLGAPLALGPKEIPISFERTLLIGEAAQLVDPLTGEGIANAILSAKFASDSIVEALNTKDYSYLKNYEKRVREELGPNLKKALKFQEIFNQPLKLKMLLSSLNYSETLRQWFLNKLFP